MGGTVVSSNRRLNKSRPECRVGDPFNNCPSGETCWRRKVGSSLTGNGLCVRNDDCLPRNVFVSSDGFRTLSRFERRCCSGRASEYLTLYLGEWTKRFVCN